MKIFKGQKTRQPDRQSYCQSLGFSKKHKHQHLHLNGWTHRLRQFTLLAFRFRCQRIYHFS
jgi:hypothetical protein